MNKQEQAIQILSDLQISKTTGFSNDFKNKFVPLLTYLGETDEEISDIFLFGGSISDLVKDFDEGIYKKHLSKIPFKDARAVNCFRGEVNKILLGYVEEILDNFESELRAIRCFCEELDGMEKGEKFIERKRVLKTLILEFIDRYFTVQNAISDDGLTLIIPEYSEEIVNRVAGVLK